MTAYTITVSAGGRELHSIRVASLEEAASSIETLKGKYGNAIFTIKPRAPNSEKNSALRTPQGR